MLNARKVQEFVIFISRSFLKYSREAFSPLIYEYNISMKVTIRWCRGNTVNNITTPPSKLLGNFGKGGKMLHPTGDRPSHAVVTIFMLSGFHLVFVMLPFFLRLPGFLPVLFVQGFLLVSVAGLPVSLLCAAGLPSGRLGIFHCSYLQKVSHPVLTARWVGMLADFHPLKISCAIGLHARSGCFLDF